MNGRERPHVPSGSPRLRSLRSAVAFALIAGCSLGRAQQQSLADAAAAAPAISASAAAAAMPRCANQKLPSYFVSDPRIVLARGGKASLYAPGTDEAFGAASPLTTSTGSGPPPPGAGAGSGTIGMTTVGRPDEGTLLLAVAQTEPDRETGLMCVTKMAPRVGMIFVFSTETMQNFWMKDTLIPLDMVFVTSSGTVSTVAANVPSARLDQAESTLARRSGKGRYVIELNAGEAARDHISAGVRLSIPPLQSED